jgi:hypothetical protein
MISRPPHGSVLSSWWSFRSLLRLGDPEDAIAAVIQASCELMDFTDQDVRVLDCSSGLDLAFGQPAAGLCLWITPTPVVPVEADLGVPVVPPWLGLWI